VARPDDQCVVTQKDTTFRRAPAQRSPGFCGER
jgi:hypothetical protein